MTPKLDLFTVLGNSFSNLSWTGFTVMCAFGVVGLLWCVMPFAVFGVKKRLEAMEQANIAKIEALMGELKRLNELVSRMPREGTKPSGVVSRQPIRRVS